MSETHEHGFVCRFVDCPDRRPECAHEDGRFISEESFVGIPPGTAVPMEGRVVSCSLCQRSGVVQRVEGSGILVIHVRATEVLGDGSRSDPEDACRVPKG